MQNLIFKGLNGEFKIAATTQYITRIKDSTKKLNWCPDPVLPDAPLNEGLASSFNAFFVDKIVKISDFLSLESRQETMNQFLQAVDQNPILSKLEVFHSSDTIEVRKIILESSSTTCDLDAFPTALFKECLNELIESLTDIVNLSLQ